MTRAWRAYVPLLADRGSLRAQERWLLQSGRLPRDQLPFVWTIEPAEYAPVYSVSKRQRTEDYALISMLTGVDGRHRLLLVNGIDAEATQIAIEYLIDLINARALESILMRAAPDHKGVALSGDSENGTAGQCAASRKSRCGARTLKRACPYRRC
jgi:hypothetical protein